MTLRKIRKFDRGDYILVIDVASGKKWREEKTAPSLARKAANFSKAAARQAMQGNPKVSLEVIQERYAICSNCPSGLFAEIDRNDVPKRLKDVEIVGTCMNRKCGCYIHETETFPNKLSWGSTSCPQKHWEST
jgi:hypothetical protein|tara:strand:+ start:168 stop:566 length:399 start_codon:yes stop_codon:yes gene_type:complete